ncbi:MAG TPA: YCF48-related protein [Saprospiraceae bacterium]|nr:YCF48-related protein [Saprospiraceae bacterium]
MKQAKKAILCLFILISLQQNRSDAQVWTPISGLPSSVGLKTVKFIDTITGWAAGENGTIIKTINGSMDWSLQTSGTTNTVRSIFFLDASNGWACGDEGTILKTSNGGTTWTPQTSPYSSQYNSIRFANTTIGWIVGSGNVLLKTIDGGINWIQQSNQGTAMWGLDILSTTNAWACGGFVNSQNSPTLIKTTNGTSWVYQTNSGVTTFLSFNDIRFPDVNNGWVVGGNGFIRHTANAGASTWTAQNSGTQFELLGVDFINPSIGYACGRQGIILATANGGTTWAAQSSSITSGTVWELDMVNDTTGYAAGDTGILKYHIYTPVQPITVLQPNAGGDIFQIGTRRFIIWQVQAGINNVKLEYSTNGNTGPWTIITPSTSASSGSFSWMVPNTPSLNCYIRISNTANNSIQDISDAPFYIMNTPFGVDYSVLTSATVMTNPAQITVAWVSDGNALSYSIDKKLPADTSWTNLATVLGTTNSYTDNAVSTGIIYEYRVVKTTPLITGYGYVYAGINIPAPDARGTLLLAVDTNFVIPLQTEIKQLKSDLIGDGWKVIQHNFSTTAKDTTVKNWVVDEYNQPGANVKSLLLIGHFAIPYSGNFAPDGHSERIGAQPADVYYADVDGAWTDNTVTTNNSGNIYTPNMPNDGKWDQSVIPSPAELQVGRIDMHSMTGFALSEADLIKQYLNKNHAYRHKLINPARKALLNTHIDSSLPSTSSGAWRSFAPMLGSNNIASMNTAGCNGNGTCGIFIDSLQSHSYLWTYLAGGGSDTSCASPVFTSSQCINVNLNTVFMQLYGSYFVEWAKGGITGTTNHLLRAPLANAGMPLATCWTGGGPRWYFHHMGLGESIGFSTLQSQNNKGLFDLGNIQLIGGVHMVLMGDPSLRLHIVYPVTDLTAIQNETMVQLNWTASADNNILGYNIYRSDTIDGDFIRLNSSIIASTQFIDSLPSLLNNNVYMVRAVKSETTPSGSYQNMSEGIFISKPIVTTFTFTGNGNWSIAGNWVNTLKPSASLPSGFSIVIDPIPGGECVLDITQHISTGANFTIRPGKYFRISDGLFLH